MMETGSPDQEVACSEEDHQQQGPVSQVRSYECTFCKRGFSNAQALGGHMNIHRKDRIKLKQPANSNHQLSSDFSKMNTLGHPVTINQRNLELQPNMSCTRKWPWIFPRDDYDVVLSNDEDHVEGEIHQLPLFEETPASSNKREFGGSYHNTGGDEEGTESNPSLDLELRLGTEPHDPSTRTGTIEFF